MVSSNEIEGNVIAFAVVDHIEYPRIYRGSGTAYAELFAYTLYSQCRVFVKFEIILLCTVKEEVKVGLVPYFEIPCLYLVETKAVNTMMCECLYELVPFLVIARQGNVSLLMEAGFCSQGDCLGHKAKFDKRLHTN